MSDSAPGVVLVVSARQTLEDGRIEQHLGAAGFVVRSAGEARAALRPSSCAPSPDVLVLSRSAGQQAADSDVVGQLRREGFAGAVLVVGPDADPACAVAALERGADDYVALSCDPTELVARVRALARRAGGGTTLGCGVGGLALDLRHGVVRGDGVEVALTRREADLLHYLARHAGRPVTRAELAAQVWHTAAGGDTNVVDVYVSYLRRKLGAVSRQALIRSVRGVGYELVDTAAS